MKDRAITTSQLSKITEIPRRTIYRWVEQGALPPWEKVSSIGKTAEGRGPGNSDLFDDACGVWALALQELFLLGATFTGKNVSQVWIPTVDKSPEDGPFPLTEGARILNALRNPIDGFDRVAVVLSGKVGSTRKPSKQRFLHIRILSTPWAQESISQFFNHAGMSLISGGPDNMVQTVGMINLLDMFRIYRHKLNNVFR